MKWLSCGFFNGQVDAPLVGGKTVLHLASLEGDVSKVDFLLNSHKVGQPICGGYRRIFHSLNGHP